MNIELERIVKRHTEQVARFINKDSDKSLDEIEAETVELVERYINKYYTTNMMGEFGWFVNKVVDTFNKNEDEFEEVSQSIKYNRERLREKGKQFDEKWKIKYNK